MRESKWFVLFNTSIERYTCGIWRQGGSGGCQSWRRRRKWERGKKMVDVGDKRKEKKRRRLRPGTVALWEICKFKISISFLIRKLPSVNWVREITQEQRGNLRFQVLALLALQEVVEAYVVNLFEDANLCVIHTKHVTLMPKDVKLACRIWGDMVKYLQN